MTYSPSRVGGVYAGVMMKTNNELKALPGFFFVPFDKEGLVELTIHDRVTTWINDSTGDMVSAVNPPSPTYREALIEVYRDGGLLVDTRYEEIKARVSSYVLTA